MGSGFSLLACAKLLSEPSLAFLHATPTSRLLRSHCRPLRGTRARRRPLHGTRARRRPLPPQQRSSSADSTHTIEELGRFITNLVAIIPEGVVVFFPSFDYERQVYDTWKVSGFLQKILKKKRLYREPRSNLDVEDILKEYKENIASGAILLAVVGGKISEGINFSDGMGRCIIMVGLPYPSLLDVELIERIKHIEGLGEADSVCKSNCGNAVKSGFNVLRSCKQRGKEYYENLCMKAVNQSIGRAIRHINDYASVLLVDSRYSCSSSANQSFSKPTDKLPLWIRDQLILATGSYGQVHRLLSQFYRLHLQKEGS